MNALVLVKALRAVRPKSLGQRGIIDKACADIEALAAIEVHLDTVGRPTVNECPFCKSSNITLGYRGQPALAMFAACLTCRAQGPEKAYYGGDMHLNDDWTWK